jgi:hypothetical protein
MPRKLKLKKNRTKKGGAIWPFSLLTSQSTPENSTENTQRSRSWADFFGIKTDAKVEDTDTNDKIKTDAKVEDTDTNDEIKTEANVENEEPSKTGGKKSRKNRGKKSKKSQKRKSYK